MSSDVVTVEEHERLSIADRVMKLGRIRHMPVVKAGRLVGLLTQRDLLHNALSEAMGGTPELNARALDAIKVADCMTSNPLSVSPETSLSEAAQLMLKNKYGCLPVLVNEELVGILTESDFVAAFV